MAWERRNGHRHYYGKVREGDQVRSVYLGKGMAADLYAVDARARKLLAEVLKDAKAHGYRIDPDLIDLARVIVGTNFKDTYAYRKAKASREESEH